MEDGTVPTETSQTSLLVEAPSPPASPAALISLSTTISPPPLPSLPPLSSSPPPSSSPPLPSLPSLSSSPPPSSSPPLLSLPSLSSSPPSSSPPLPSLLPRPHHARSLRPKPSPPPLSTPRPTQHPPRPPLPPTSAPPSTPTPSSPPPPLSPLLKPPTDPKPPQSLFGGLSPPLSPTLASAPSPLSSSKLPTSSSSFRSSSTLSSPLNPSSSSPLLDPVSLSPFPVSEGTGGFQSTLAMGFRERLIGSAAVWQLKEFSPEKVTRALEREAAGVFLVQSRGDGVTMLSVRLPDGREPSTQHIVVKEYKTFLHLEGSHLVFGSIFKLVIFYCFSRDVLPVTLRLPEVITNATKEELTLISAKPEEFWTLVPGQAVQDGEEEQLENQDIVSVQNYNSQPTPPVAQDQFCFVNPDMVEDHIKNLHPSNDPSAAPSFVLQSPLSSIATVCNVSQTQSPTSVFPLQDPPLGMKVASKQENYSDANVQNGETIKKPEVLGQSGKPSTKFKRPPPRPPSLGVPLPSSPCDANTSSPLPAEKDKKEEDVKREEEKEKGRVEGGGREKRKSAPASAPPSRPPVPSQIRAPPRLPPAPLRRALSKKSSQGAGEGEECRRETEGHAVKREEEKRAEDKTEQSSTLLVDLLQQDASLHSSQGRNKKEDNEAIEKREDGGKEREEEGEAREADKDNVIEQGPNTSIRPSLKKPSRPVPPPRRKPTATRPSLSYPGPLGGGSTNQSTGIKLAPPTAARRPDVSLYSPQGGSVVGMDPDSCSNSSSEEEGEVCQEQEQNQSRSADSYIHKAVKRTSTTIILGRARDHLSSVLTGLISYDRRLTQRIVELARDPLSYFGNLVKEHRMFTLETMSRHLSSTELLQEIRTMMTQLKSYLLQSTELQGMMEPQHQYTQDKLESIAEAALCKSVLKPLREPIYHSLEQLHTDDGGLQQLAQNQSSVLGSTSTALGVTTAVPEAPTMEKISGKLRRLHLEYSPQRKIELLLKTCKIIYDSMSISCPGRAHGADDFLPVLMYVLARSNLAQLKLDVEYMMELMDPSLTLGEGSYYLTTTYGALEHIKSFDQQRAATRQLSREVQDSIHRWERRRTLNKERMAQGSVQDFLTVCCPEIGLNPKALGVLPNTTIQELAEQCAVRFEQESYNISVFVDGVKRPLAPTKLALSVKSSLSPGGYCFVFHPAELSEVQPGNAHPGGLERSLDGRAETCFQASDATQGEVEESLISL